MQLLERETATNQLLALLEEAATGDGRLILMGGEAGIGKTVFVRHFAEAVRDTTRILIGACDALSHPAPLGPLLDVAPHLGSQVQDLLGDPDRRSELFAAVLAGLTETRPTLFIVEDAHWADAATLDLLRYLGRRIDRTRALVIVTYRDDEVGPRHPLRILLGDLATQSNVRKFSLSVLTEAAVYSLAAGTDLDALELHRRTGGNPFFVTEVIASGAPGIPATVRDAVLNRTARLSELARSTLDAAAVIGHRVDPDLLSGVANVRAASVEESLEAGLLRVESGFLEFRHALTREAILSAISPIRLIELHRAVLAELLKRSPGPGDFARVAHHAEAAGDADAVLRYAPEAGRHAAELGAHREAAAQYARALRFGKDLPERERERLLEGRLMACYVNDQNHEAARAGEELIAHARAAGNPLREAKWLSWQGIFNVSTGRNSEADQAVQAAIRLLADLPEDRIHGFAFWVQGHLRMLDRDSVEAIKWADLAADLAARFGDVSLQARALNTLGSARIVSEVDIETGRDNLEQSLALARQAQIDSVAANAFNNLGSGFGEIYRFDLAERYLTEGVAFTGERDLDRYHMYMTAWLALTYMYQGRWTDAAELANAVIRKPELAEITRTMALLALGRVRARRGDPEVWPILDEALALAQPTGTLQRIGPVRAARAEAAWLAGDSELAGAEARAGFELATRQQHRWHIGELGYWAWVAGVPLELPPAAFTPFTCQMGGDWSAAAEHWRELGCPYESARALAESDSQDSLRTAFTTFDELGARPAAAMTAKRLRDLGATAVPRGARSSTRSNPARLTTRETEVLAVIVEGRTNAEIAQRLFLSPKTVQRHVTSILGKLGVDSRREAARMAVQRSLVPMERIETARR